MNNEYGLTNDYLRSWIRLVQSKIVNQYSIFTMIFFVILNWYLNKV